MNHLKLLFEIIFKLIAIIYTSVSVYFIRILISFRENKKYLDSLVIDDVIFRKERINLNNYDHEYSYCGNSDAGENETLIMMGGIPTDSSESMMWMAAEIYKKNPSFKIFILHLPFYENYSEITMNHKGAMFDSLTIPFNREISNKNVRIDPKFNHKNQSKIVGLILKKLNLTKAHFIGHDRGVVVFEHLMQDQENLFLSFSRGAQAWDFYRKEWSKLAPNICVGPPHRFFTYPWQLKFLFNIITFFNFPFAIRSDGFLKKCMNARKGSELYNRYTHLTFKANSPTNKFLLKVRQTMLQTDSLKEIENRKYLPKNIKIMQFQGEDEFKLNSKKKLISDQPYFGKYNLFKNEIKDLYPNCVSQDLSQYQSQYIQEKNEYKKVDLLPNARMSFFALIPDSAHFNVIENPEGCASAVSDFIQECNLGNL